jgi:hypothetical protein
MDLATEIQTAAIIVAAIVATYQFYLKDILRPRQEPTALELTANLSNVGEDKGNLLIKAAIETKNPTERRVYVPAFWFTVRGISLSPSPSDPGPELFDGEVTEIRDLLLRRCWTAADMQVVAQRRIVYDGYAWWEPNDRTHDEEVFIVPKGKFDYLELRVTYLMTRAGQALDAPDWWTNEDGSWGANMRFRLKQDSALEALDYGNKRHESWAFKTGAGQNWYAAALPLWPGPAAETKAEP